MKEQIFYIGAMSAKDSSGGIAGYILENGVPVQQFYHHCCGVKYLAWSQNKRVLYATTICDAANSVGAVSAFRVLDNGALEFINEVSANGVSTCHLAAAPGGKYLYAVNYMTSALCEFTLQSNGAIGCLKRQITFTGKGSVPRQEAPHPHFTGFTPDGELLAVVDLGLDAVKLFDFDPEKGLIAPEKPYLFKVEPAGTGPRHLTFNRAGERAYLVNELANSVYVLEWKNKTFTLLQKISTLPENFTGETKASAIRFSPDERFLFASNRGYDSIAVYRVLDSGLLELQEIVPSEGVSPRDINFLPGGKMFAAANEFTNNTAFFDYEPVTGKLAYKEISETLVNPLAIYW